MLACTSGTVGAQQTGISSLIQKQHQGPLDVTGKHFVYDYKTDSFIVTGNSTVTQRDSVLTADKITLVRRNRELIANGNVHVVDPLGQIWAKDAKLNLNNETTDLTDATITNAEGSYRLTGARIRKNAGQRYSIIDGSFTTCGQEPGTPDWSISGDNMDVHLGETAHAHGAYLNVLGYPVLYSPYAVFPADTSRHSGLLSPRLGESGLRGFQLLQPYYWAINKSSDASVALDVETSQRIGGLAEYRLISGPDDYFVLDGAFYDESIRSEQNRQDDIIDTQLADPHIPVNRYDIIAMARQHLTDNLVAYGDALTVSDSLFLREMNVWTLSRTATPGVVFPTNFASMRDAISDFGLLDSYNNGFIRLQGRWNQDLIQQQEFALQTLPDLLVSGRKELLGGLAYADYDLSGTDFWREKGQDGWRFDLSPSLTVPWRLGDYLYGFGRVGVRETMYSVGGHEINVIPVGTGGRIWNNGLALGPLGPGGFQSREIGYGEFGIASEVEKIYDINWRSLEKIKHTIEPFATYTYVPRVDQSNLPLFDEVDRMEARSLIEYGFTSRIYAKLVPSHHQESVEGLGEQPNGEESSLLNPFRARSVVNGSGVEELLRFSMLQAYDTTYAIAKGGSRFSDLDLSGLLFPTRIWSFGGQLGYSPQNTEVRYASAFLNFQPWWTRNTPRLYTGKAESGSFLQFSYNYIGPGPDSKPGVNASFSEFMTARAYYDLFDRMGVYFAPSYDIAAAKMISTEYGVRLKSPCDCWAFDVGITKTVNPSETQLQFQLTLGGLGSVGQSPFGRNPFQLRSSVLPNYR